MKTRLFTGTFAALATFLFFAGTNGVDAGVVIPDSANESSQPNLTETLPEMPNYALPDAKKEAPRYPSSYNRGAGSGYGAPGASQNGARAGVPQSLPLPPTYSPGAPASGSQPDATLPRAPTSYGTYDSPMSQGAGQSPSGSGFGPSGPTRMAPNSPGGYLPQSPTGGATSPMAAPSLAVTESNSVFGPYGNTSIREATSLQSPSNAYRQASSVMTGRKAFKDYRQASPYSPYMSLFRTQDASRGINNYYSYVKPELDQRQQNQQVGREIGGLQNAAQYQGMSLEQVNQRNQSAQRPGNVIPGGQQQQRAPATYMNTFQFYPQRR